MPCNGVSLSLSLCLCLSLFLPLAFRLQKQSECMQEVQGATRGLTRSEPGSWHPRSRRRGLITAFQEVHFPSSPLLELLVGPSWAARQPQLSATYVSSSMPEPPHRVSPPQPATTPDETSTSFPAPPCASCPTSQYEPTTHIFQITLHRSQLANNCINKVTGETVPRRLMKHPSATTQEQRT